jgi:hypothetical protein
MAHLYPSESRGAEAIVSGWSSEIFGFALAEIENTESRTAARISSPNLALIAMTFSLQAVRGGRFLDSCTENSVPLERIYCSTDCLAMTRVNCSSAKVNIELDGTSEPQFGKVRTRVAD